MGSAWGPVAASSAAATQPATRPLGQSVSKMRQVLSLNRGWRFLEGDVPFPKVMGHGWSYANAKAGSAWGAASPIFDDSEWSTVTLPHDFASFQLPDKNENLAQGYRKRGIAWYRNLLRFEPSDRGKHIELHLDGISTHATVWLNGTLVNRNWSGYNSIYIDITPYITYGESLNSLVVRVDADQMQGWWYEGAGIYRNTWIVKRDPVHIVTDGVFAHPVKYGDQWTIPLEVTLYNAGKTARTVQVTSTVRDPKGKAIATTRMSATVTALSRAVSTGSMTVSQPSLWNIETPFLYSITTQVISHDRVLDEVVTPAGFRTQHFDPNRGFFLNDQPVKLKGVCIHQDHAGVGVAVPHGILHYRLQRLKDLGCNAIRCSHNAQDKYFYELCDQMGFLVMDENRVFNPSPIHMNELEWLVRRDRNHPSVILWSVFNEEPMQGSEQGFEMVRRMSALVKTLDTSRPVTAAMNDGLFTPINVSQAVDVVGFNYQYQSYDAFHKANPNIPLTSSEDTSAYQTRGEYTTDDARHIKATYDDDAAEWGTTHRTGWKAIAERDFIAGAFVWTGFDYHGEPTPYDWPSNSSQFGIMDLCGFEKNAFWLHKAQWDQSPVLRIAPHWTWSGKQGQPIRVMAFHNMDEVELFLNGKSLGKQKGDIFEMNRWEVPYAPGTLHAVGYRQGKAAAKHVVETTGAPVSLKLTPHRKSMWGDGLDAQPIKVEAVDARGRHVPIAQNQITFDITGGDIIGLGNGNPNDVSSEKGNTRALFNGLAQIIVQTKENSAGTLQITATAAGLTAAKIEIEVEKAAAWPYQDVSTPVQITEGWRRAPAQSAPIDPNLRPKDNDMNSWGWFRPGVPFSPLATDSYVLCATVVEPFKRIRKAGGQVECLNLMGACTVFVDGIEAANKSDPGAGDLKFNLPAGDGARRLTIIFRAKAGQPFGFGDVLRIRTV
nr:beta-galactosidase GalA [Asticcacaulis machinosus]